MTFVEKLNQLRKIDLMQGEYIDFSNSELNEENVRDIAAVLMSNNNLPLDLYIDLRNNFLNDDMLYFISQGIKDNHTLPKGFVLAFDGDGFSSRTIKHMIDAIDSLNSFGVNKINIISEVSEIKDAIDRHKVFDGSCVARKKHRI